jgi:hypothetical protein
MPSLKRNQKSTKARKRLGSDPELLFRHAWTGGDGKEIEGDEWPATKGNRPLGWAEDPDLRSATSLRSKRCRLDDVGRASTQPWLDFDPIPDIVRAGKEEEQGVRGRYNPRPEAVTPS